LNKYSLSFVEFDRASKCISYFCFSLFRILDDDSNRKLNMDEFKKGISEYGLNLSKPEIEQLFRQFDVDNNGSIDFDEFLRRLRVCFTLCERN
jgi:Ca2+-binding EF-hand superfamily protein